MLFNSIEFILFLPAVFVLFWFVFKHSLKAQNLLIISASYLFYGWWDWRFLGLIILSSILDFMLAQGIEKSGTKTKKKLLLWTSIVVNLGILGFFKYFNFFVDSAEEMLSIFGMDADFVTLNVLLPVGISFYTFQTLSYTIDVYREEIKAEKDIFAFFAYVSFFPQLVAGPIERAKNFLPQFSRKKEFTYDSAVDGCRQILWGFFKKVVIADSCAPYVDLIFSEPANYNGPTLLLGAVLFAFQIYGDFSGYTDIAIGTARLFGFNLMRNFAYPYFSRDIAEFWRRWHISLSSWFKDYLYFPLGGSRGSKAKTIRNVFAIFLVSGFWHGANWTFVVWGGLNALYFLPSLITGKNRKHLDTVSAKSMLPSLIELKDMLTTFLMTCLAWVFFRAESVRDAFNYLWHLCNPSIWGTNNKQIYDASLNYLFIFITILLLVEWNKREQEHGLAKLSVKPWIRYNIYIVTIFTILFHWGGEQEFIYFQF